MSDGQRPNRFDGCLVLILGGFVFWLIVSLLYFWWP